MDEPSEGNFDTNQSESANNATYNYNNDGSATPMLKQDSIGSIDFDSSNLETDNGDSNNNDHQNDAGDNNDSQDQKPEEMDYTENKDGDGEQGDVQESSENQPNVSSETPGQGADSQVQDTPSMSNDGFDQLDVTAEGEQTPASLKRSISSVSANSARKRSKVEKAAEKRAKVMASNEDVLKFVVPYCDAETLPFMSGVSKGVRDQVTLNPNWRTSCMSLVRTLHGHIAAVTAIAMVQQFVFTGSADGKIKIWNTRTWRCERTMHLNKAIVNPNSQYDAMGRNNPNSKGAKPQGKKMGTEDIVFELNGVTSLAIYEKSVLIGHENGELLWRMMEPQHGRTRICQQAHQGAVRAIAVNAKVQGPRAITGGADNKVRFWGLNTVGPTASLQPLAEFALHTKPVTAIDTCLNHVFTGSEDGSIRVWDLKDLKAKDQLKITRPAHAPEGGPGPAPITALTVFDNKLYSAAWDCYIRVWDAKKLIMLKEIFNCPVGVTWSMAVRAVKGQKTTLVCGVRDGDVELRLIDKNNSLEKIASDTENAWCSRLEKHSDWITCCAALPDGRIITGSEDWSLKVWNYRFAPPPDEPPPRPAPGRQTSPAGPPQRPPSSQQQAGGGHYPPQYAQNNPGSQQQNPPAPPPSSYGGYPPPPGGNNAPPAGGPPRGYPPPPPPGQYNNPNAPQGGNAYPPQYPNQPYPPPPGQYQSGGGGNVPPAPPPASYQQYQQYPRGNGAQ